ncbi:MAG: hypothetical protein JO153_12425 [Solirubrobacterales bacterium]|nr:hypothetical protein [Solirubrobacterales bacterium]MBV9917299.1 hypothetical protein [Solirubrobacterales bacterium]
MTPTLHNILVQQRQAEIARAAERARGVADRGAFDLAQTRSDERLRAASRASTGRARARRRLVAVVSFARGGARS